MNKPGSAYCNDDDALATTLRKSRGERERQRTYRHFAAALAEDLQGVPQAKNDLPRAWGMLVTWIKEQTDFTPLRQPLATYLLGFLQTSTQVSIAPTHRRGHRYLSKGALIELAPESAACREGIALRFADSCYRILRKYFPEREERPEEIYGEAITDLFANLPRPQTPETATLFTYFMTIAHRKYARHLKQKHRQPAPPAHEETWDRLLRDYDRGYSEETEDFADVLAECQSVVARKFVFNNEGELVKKLLLLLQPTYREALELRFLAEMDYAEIAEKTDCTPENARARVHRGLNKLRQLLNRKA